MKRVLIYGIIRDPRNHSKILGKKKLRKVTVQASFEGIGPKGEIIRPAFQRLADTLEPLNDGFEVI